MAIKLRHYFEFGDFRLEHDRSRLWQGDKLVHVRPKAIEILYLLIENRSRVVHRDEILEAVWKDTFVEEGNINFNISVLRKALSVDGRVSVDQILTVPKEGYRFVGDVREVIEEEAEGTTIEREVIAAGSLEAAVLKIKESPAIANARVRWHFIGIVMLGVLMITSFAVWWSVDQSTDASPSRQPDIRSLAILPPVPIDRRPENEALSLGIADQLISKFGSIDRFTVRPYNAVAETAAGGESPLAIGERLGVDAVLEGTLQTDGNRARINARLLYVRDGTQLWNGSFDESADDLFRLQDAMAAEIAASLRIELAPDEAAAFEKRYTEDREAYLAYLRGRYFFDKRTPRDLELAMAEFERAITLDPNYALAYSGLADVHAMQTVFETSREAAMKNSRVNALKALELDEQLAEAHTSLAWIYRNQDWNWELSERHFKRAIELNPNYVNARQWYALLLSTLGRLDEAEAQIEKALEIDPLSRVVLENKLAVILNRSDTKSITHLSQRIAEMQNDESAKLRGLAIASSRIGDDVRTVATAEQLKRLRNGKTDSKSLDARLAVAYQRLGRNERSRRLLSALEESFPKDAYVAYHLAMAYADLGNNAKAIELLELCLRARDDRLLWIKVEPRFVPLRDDPRFQAIIRKMNLPAD